MRPNILYIHSHDTGRYVQPYGHAIPTPHLQRFAEQGILFRKAFCAGPTCSPSRAALLTGQAPHSCGMIGLAHRGFSLNDYSQHLVSTLRDAGYHTALSGVQHVARDRARIGYDQILNLQGGDPNTAETAVEYLSNAPSQPFFLSVGFGVTHREFPQPGPREDERYCLPPAPLPDTPRTRRDMAAFKASARKLDEYMGTVFDALDANELTENTLVICTTDHGIAFPGMKCNLTDHGIGVMLMMRGPGGFSQGLVCDALVSHVDIFPTVCDLLGIDAPVWLQGKSMMPLIRDGAEEINDAIFSEVTYHAAYEPKRAVRTERWKYIRHFGERKIPVLPNCDDSPSKDIWLEQDWSERQITRERLYDLVFDPNETNNLAGEATWIEELQEMRDRLDSWMHATQDPLLDGFALAPEGARVNDASGISPRERTQSA